MQYLEMTYKSRDLIAGALHAMACGDAPTYTAEQDNAIEAFARVFLNPRVTIAILMTDELAADIVRLQNGSV